MKRCTFMSAAATAAMVGILGFSAPAFAASGYGNVEVKTDAGKSITIGNDAFARTFSFKDGKLKTTLIDNKLGKTQIVPGAKSEEFLIEGMFEAARQEPQKPLTSVKSGAAAEAANITVTASSYDATEQALAAKAIDGKNDTYWASTETANKDIWFEIDFGANRSFKSFSYVPRYDGSAHYHCTGQIWNYKIQKWDGKAWVDAYEGEFKKGKEDGKQDVTLPSIITAQKIRIAVTDSYHWQSDKGDTSMNGKFANIAEIDFFDESGKSIVHPEAVEAGEWSITTNSDKGSGDGQGIKALIDGNLNSYWHCNYENGQPVNMPATITIDRGDAQKDVAFQTVGYAGRKEGASTNGNFKKYAVYASNTKEGLFDEKNLKDTCEVSYAGAYANGSHKMVYCGLDEAVTGRYVGIKVLDGNGGFAAGAELDLFKEKFDSVPETGGGILKASAMKLAGDPVVMDTTATI